MRKTLRFAHWLVPLLMLFSMAAMAGDAPVLRVAYAGSMGVVLDPALGPAVAHN